MLIALGVALLTIFLTEVNELRRGRRGRRMLSEIVADNAISPLRFDDFAKVAVSLLGALRHLSGWPPRWCCARMAACLPIIPWGCTPTRSTWPACATTRPRARSTGTPSAWSSPSPSRATARPSAGLLILEFDLRSIVGRLVLWLGLALLGLVVALIAASLFSRRMQGMIVEPLQSSPTWCGR